MWNMPSWMEYQDVNSTLAFVSSFMLSGMTKEAQYYLTSLGLE
jgi:hypothetical protein